MAENFLSHSHTFVEITSQIGHKGRKMGTKHINKIISFLIEDYQYPQDSTERDFHERISQTLQQENNIDIKKDAIRTTIRMVQFAWTWLRSDEKKKREIEDEIKVFASPSSYFLGIKCLKEDGITSWEQILELQKKKEVLARQKPPEVILASSVEIIEESADIISEEGLEISLPDTPTELTVLTDQLHETMNQYHQSISNQFQAVCSRYSKIISTLRKSNIELLDENQALAASHKSMGIRYDTLVAKTDEQAQELKATVEKMMAGEKELATQAAEMRKLSQKNADIKKQLENTREELQKVKKELGERISLLERENRLLKQGTIDQLVEKALASEASRISLASEPAERRDEPQPPIAIEYAPPKKNGIKISLPVKYVPTGGKAEFSDFILEFISDLGTSDRKLQGMVLSKLNLLCSQGIEAVSFPIKTMRDASDHSPANSQQITLNKKYRVTFSLTEDGITFHEMFHRKNTPYGSSSRN